MLIRHLNQLTSSDEMSRDIQEGGEYHDIYNMANESEQNYIDTIISNQQYKENTDRPRKCSRISSKH